MENAVQPAIEVGNTLDALPYRTVSGKNVDIAEVAGKNGTVVGFLHGTYCPHCLQQLTRSNSYAEQLRLYDVSLVWVLQDSPVNIDTYRLAARQPPRFTMWAQDKIAKPNTTDEKHAPTLFYLDTKKRVRYIERPENPHAPPDMPTLLAVIEATKAI